MMMLLQVDEPALREGMPTRPDKKDAYLQWAVDSFLLATCGADPAVQVAYTCITLCYLSC
jgi:5-methyltetrahydropteroyltriglutamate--homocysteine methyltransferase